MIRLLALDIDGTILDSDGHLPAANRDAIARAIDAGVEVALATGRRYDFARPIFEQLPGTADAHPQQRRGRQDTRRGDGDAPSAAARRRAPRPRAASRSTARAPRSCSTVRARARSCSRRSTGTIRGTSRSSRPIGRSWPRCAARGLPHRGSDPGDVHRRLRRDARSCSTQLRADAGGAPTSRSRLTEYHAPRLLARRRRAGRLLEGLGAARLGGAPRLRAGRGHGDGRQPERSRDARVCRLPGA